MKTVAFHTGIIMAIIGIAIVDTMTSFAIVMMCAGVSMTWTSVRSMTLENVYEVTGANFFNKVLKTNDFTQE